MNWGEIYGDLIFGDKSWLKINATVDEVCYNYSKVISLYISYIASEIRWIHVPMNVEKWWVASSNTVRNEDAFLVVSKNWIWFEKYCANIFFKSWKVKILLISVM